jgi:hypothetical protein
MEDLRQTEHFSFSLNCRSALSLCFSKYTLSGGIHSTGQRERHGFSAPFRQSAQRKRERIRLYRVTASGLTKKPEVNRKSPHATRFLNLSHGIRFYGAT